MIQYVKGNLLESDAEALVNTVNTVGVMGKGIALQFREAFPENYRVYKKACLNKELHIGELLIVEDSNLMSGRKLIVNFPTKTHWKLPSEYTYIEQGLTALRREIVSRKIQSIAIPPLGSHNGGLDWLQVKRMIETALADLDCDIMIYEPSEIIIEKMKSERVKLTPGRAMLLLMFNDAFTYGEFASVFAAEKMIYFMQRFGAKDYFKIDFKPYYYGPYSGGKVAHVLYNMNGSYIKGMGGMENRPFDYIWLIDGAVQEANGFIDGYHDNSLRSICDKTQHFLRGYYSNYALELLATVDYLLENAQSLKDWRNKNIECVLDILEKEIQEWSKRKEKMFNRDWLNLAVTHLRENIS
ncbi:MAG: macro domain-containing protein [Prevotella sp.]|nr:macro domain-containing protein [Prevotella sp.]